MIPEMTPLGGWDRVWAQLTPFSCIHTPTSLPSSISQTLTSKISLGNPRKNSTAWPSGSSSRRKSSLVSSEPRPCLCPLQGQGPPGDLPHTYLSPWGDHVGNPCSETPGSPPYLSIKAYGPHKVWCVGFKSGSIFCEAPSLELPSACCQGVAEAHTGSRSTGHTSVASPPRPSTSAHRLGSSMAEVRHVGGTWGPDGAAALRGLRAHKVIPSLVPQRERWPVKHQQLHQPVLLVFWNIGLPVQADVWDRCVGRGVRNKEGASKSSLGPHFPAALRGCPFSHTQGGGVASLPL